MNEQIAQLKNGQWQIVKPIPLGEVMLYYAVGKPHATLEQARDALTEIVAKRMEAYLDGFFHEVGR